MPAVMQLSFESETIFPHLLSCRSICLYFCFFFLSVSKGQTKLCYLPNTRRFITDKQLFLLQHKKRRQRSRPYIGQRNKFQFHSHDIPAISSPRSLFLKNHIPEHYVQSPHSASYYNSFEFHGRHSQQFSIM